MLSLGKLGSELSSGRSRRSSGGFRSHRSGRSAFDRNDNAAGAAAVATVATAVAAIAAIAAVATAMAAATAAVAAVATAVAARASAATMARMAAVAAVARRVAAIAAATLATKEASIGLLLAADEGDANQREKDRDTQNDNTVHPRILQLLTGTSKRKNYPRCHHMPHPAARWRAARCDLTYPARIRALSSASPCCKALRITKAVAITQVRPLR